MVDEPRWETCQIVFSRQDGMFNQGYHFWADAIGQKGRYSAGRSRKWNQFTEGEAGVPHGNNKNAVAAFDSLVEQQLVKDGWRPVESRGTGWWETRFRRLVTTR